jgi:hypothetical protein
MTIRSLNADLKSSLLNYDPFIVVHLVKFEKPQKATQHAGRSLGLAVDFGYFTDCQYDIEYDDGAKDLTGNLLGSQNYIANKLTSLGTINESILAKASNLSMILDSSSLGASAIVEATFTAAEMATDIDLVSAGFSEGDKILLTGSAGNTNAGQYVRIDKFKNEGKTVSFTQVSAIIANGTAQTYTVSLSSEEINVILADKAGANYTNYINREVYIYKAHINPSTRQIIGAPFLYFKGITSGAAITEKLDSSKISWTLSSHWGDFLRVQGRLTDDSAHRALKADGTPDIEATIKPAYASDLGFLHSNAAVNAISTYNVKETRYKEKSSGGLSGLFGGKKLVSYEVDVPRTVDLQFNIQAKMLPVVYGVQKIDSFPIFVDTDKDNSQKVYRADALCEGPIAGILDIHIDDQTTICIDASDSDVRSNGDESVEVVCTGRQDRGDTLSHYDARSGNELSFLFTGGGRNFNSIGNLNFNSGTFNILEFIAQASGSSNANNSAATGILHEGTHTINTPISASFTVHSGQPNQRADHKLVQIASENSFKVQSDYYTGSEEYWGPSHQVLDTAYVVGEYTISEGETSLPELEFVVRGRDPECYNYDGSYRLDEEQNSASVGTFLLHHQVTLHKTSDDTQLNPSNLRIVDKWSTYDVDGNSDHRFRFDEMPLLGTTTSFYMKRVAGGARWYMQTWDHQEGVSSARDLYETGLSFAAGTFRGKKITLSSPTDSLRFALNHYRTVVGLYKSTDPRFMASNYGDYQYDLSTNVIDNLIPLESTSGITRVYPKNAIRLNSGASSVDDYYKDNRVTVQDVINGTVHSQIRKIVAYDGATKVAIVDEPWDYLYIPNSSTTYEIGSVGDRRVTLNPAMQLLDYMTNIRYGKGLNVDDDIDIASWQAAARECDTRSDVTIVVPSNTSAYNSITTLATKWTYPATSTPANLQWLGVVSSVRVIDSNYTEITFTDCVGKLGTRWNSWKDFGDEELYWHEGQAYIASVGGTIATTPNGSGALTSLNLGNFTASGTTSTNIDITHSSANGNPIVKKYDSSSLSFNASGYSLYDSNDVKYWRYLGWDDSSQRNVTRHQMNQVIDTKQPIFDNINKMLFQFNGILRYAVGKYELDIKAKKAVLVDAEKISADDIVGTIKLSDKGLKNSKNSVSTSIIDPNNKFEGRNISFFNSTYLKEDKGIQKKGQFAQPGVTNYYNARFNIKQYLDESRYGLQIQFTMAPRGLLLLAGNIVEITYPRFGYVSKEFRIININFQKDGLVDITADEHNDEAYVVLSEGDGYGVVSLPSAGPQARTVPIRPTGLGATQSNQGEVILTWANSTGFTSSTHHVEIYRGSVNSFANAGTELIGTSITDTFHDPISEGQGLRTRYYWIRYQVKTPTPNLAGSSFRLIPSVYYPNIGDAGFTNGEGVTGIGLSINAVRAVKLSSGTTTFVYNLAGDAIENGYNTTTTLAATTTNEGGTVTYIWKKTNKAGTVSVIAGATAASYVYTPTASFDDMPETISVFITDTVGSETFLANDSKSFSASRIIANGIDGADGYTVAASNGLHSFAADTDGDIGSTSSFSSTFNVLKGSQPFTYDGTIGYTTNSYRFGAFSGVNPSNSVVPVNTGGTISISNNGAGLLTGTSVVQATFEVPVIDNADDTVIGIFKFSLGKTLNGTLGVRGGSIFTLEESDANMNTDDTYAAAWAGTLTTLSSRAIAADVIAAAEDGFIRPNDRITVTDNSENIAGTRVYIGSATSASTSVGESDFSALVVETFPGSVIVDGTMSASKLAADTTVTNNLTIGSEMQLSSAGKFYTTNKGTFADNDAGFFLGYEGGAHKLNLGNATSFVKWNGSSMSIAGEITMLGASQINGINMATVTGGAASGATANQDTTASILSSNHTGALGGVSAATVNNYGGIAGGSQSATSTVTKVNSNGLVVIDTSGVKRVKLGNLSAL